MVKQTYQRFSAGRVMRYATVAVAALALAGCDTASEDAGSDIDAALNDDANDPAMTEALEDQILVDPDLAEGSNRNAVRGQGGANAIPADGGTLGSAAEATRAAMAAVGRGGMMEAPEPNTVSSASDCVGCATDQGTTLGERAEAQANGAGQASCDAQLTYDMNWANRMPATFAIYPRSQVREAAGVDGGMCNLRVVTFSTRAGVRDVVNFYYTQARRAGYSAEYQIRDGEHVLGGTRESDDGAYVLFLRRLSDGRTEVDLVANNGS